MNIYAISDLHLPGGACKPMDIFGEHWKDHYEYIKKFWKANIHDDDYILHCGDFCWAMKLSDAAEELNSFAELPGHKILIRGNHDLWWTSVSKMTAVIDKSITFVQNNSFVINDDNRLTSIIICGTRGWAVPGSADYTEHDEKIYKREILRVKLSLESALKSKTNCKYANTELIAMLHYPPLPMYGTAADNNTELNSVLEQYGVNKVVFGHIHKPQQVKNTHFNRGNIQYFLTSCDMINNTPVIIY